MGGCRCTYRNCTVKTDGKTHMFHYPVFEKFRCHQWLINAHRLDFLNLKVSQLKNRCICQHHFKDDCFMNFKKDKLTFDAVPTEDGPYCDTTNYVDLNSESSNLFSVIIDDIDNEYGYSGIERKANYAMKYGDFLANLDLMDMVKIDDDGANHKNIENDVDIKSPNKSKSSSINDDGAYLLSISLPDKSYKKSLSHPTLAVSPYMTSTSVTYTETQNNQEEKSKANNEENISANNRDGNVRSNPQQRTAVKKEPKVQIISEKKITDPVSISGKWKFESVTPNFLLNVSQIKSRIRKNSPSESFLDDTSKSVVTKVTGQDQGPNKKIEIEIEPTYLLNEEENKPITINNTSENMLTSNVDSDKRQHTFDSDKSCKVPFLKPNIPPERVEAINKKRKFNMKLRDMVESCLDKLDNYDKPNEKIKPVENPITKITHQYPSTPPKSSHTHSQEHIIAVLEARMKKMEDNLLEKITQNSKTIVDLQRTFVTATQEIKSVAKVGADEEARKKQLFHEISKYLSPSSKSLIYEELFINKFALQESNVPAKYKRRRCT